jgi:hypothetical protein
MANGQKLASWRDEYQRTDLRSPPSAMQSSTVLSGHI